VARFLRFGIAWKLVASLVVLGGACCSAAAGVSTEDRSIDECDRLAATSFEDDLPLEVVGLAPSQVDPKLAVPACEAAVKAAPDNPRLMFQLGWAYERAGNYDGARDQFAAAHAKGYALGTLYLGGLYAAGKGVVKDDRRAAEYYRIAADHGSPVGEVALAAFFEAGRGGLAVDEVQARQLYEQAASQSYAPAQNALGNYFENGRGGLAKDDAQAARIG
jgi:TPR repeat protein